MRQCPDEIPLIRAGILRLIQQHMRNAPIKLVEYPTRHALRFKQRTCFLDQIVKVERPAPCFFIPIGLQRRQADTDQRGRSGIRLGPLQHFHQLPDARRLTALAVLHLEILRQNRAQLAGCLGVGILLPELALVCQEKRRIGGPDGFRRFRAEHLFQDLSSPLIGRCSFE